MDSNNYIIKQLKGELSDKEQLEFDEWLASSKKNKEDYEQLKLVWEKSGDITFQPNKNNAWDNIQRKINATQKPNFKWMVRVAALLLLSISTWSYFHFFTSDYTVVIAENQPKKVTLRDGSIITLNKNASLKYSSFENQNERKVELTGEAYFEIAKDKKHPFIVSCEKFNVKVVGTAFNINNSLAELSVFSGKVIMSNSQQEITLVANESATLTPDNRLQKTTFNANSCAWKTGKLSFNNTPLKEVVKVLQNKFDVQIKIENNTLYNCSFTGEFDKNTSLNQILLVLQKALNLSITENNEQNFVLSGKGC